MPTPLRRNATLPGLLVAALLLSLTLSPAPLRAGVYPDPVCEQSCYDNYVFCYYEVCDQRGDCSYCWADYLSCVGYCPLVCEEPRSVRDYTQVVYFNAQLAGTVACLRNGPGAKKHNQILYQQRVDTYRETTHCNGTKTTQLLSTGTPSGVLACWVALNPPQFCSSNNVGFLCPF